MLKHLIRRRYLYFTVFVPQQARENSLAPQVRGAELVEQEAALRTLGNRRGDQGPEAER